MEEHTYSRGKPFWNAYLRGRPQIPESLFIRFYSYHAANGGKFEDVNDVGAGLGNLSLRLAERFSRVIVTEPSETTLRDAETFIRQVSGDAGASASPFSFVNAAAEDDALAPASVDAVFCVNTMHWVDAPRALAQFARQLTSGGTLFMAMTGLPILLSADAQPIWQRLIAAYLPGAAQRFLEAGGPDAQQTWRRACIVQESGYDAIDVPTCGDGDGDDDADSDGDLFEPEVQRVRLNAAPHMREFHRPSGLTQLARQHAQLGVHDEICHEQDNSWSFDTDMARLAEILKAYMPADGGNGGDNSPGGATNDDTRKLWMDLAAVIGGPGDTVRAYYPVSIIMATRK